MRGAFAVSATESISGRSVASAASLSPPDASAAEGRVRVALRLSVGGGGGATSSAITVQTSTHPDPAEAYQEKQEPAQQAGAPPSVQQEEPKPSGPPAASSEPSEQRNAEASRRPCPLPAWPPHRASPALCVAFCFEHAHEARFSPRQGEGGQAAEPADDVWEVVPSKAKKGKKPAQQQSQHPMPYGAEVVSKPRPFAPRIPS